MYAPSPEHVLSLTARLSPAAGRRRRPWTGVVLALLALWFVHGGHWFAFQSVAWTRMLVVYSAQTSFGSALLRTFSGKAPCCLCRQIQRGQQEERDKSSFKLAFERFELLADACPAAAPAPATIPSSLVLPEPLPLDGFAFPPPKPPPRLT